MTSVQNVFSRATALSPSTKYICASDAPEQTRKTRKWGFYGKSLTERCSSRPFVFRINYAMPIHTNTHTSNTCNVRLCAFVCVLFFYFGGTKSFNHCRLYSRVSRASSLPIYDVYIPPHSRIGTFAFPKSETPAGRPAGRTQ